MERYKLQDINGKVEDKRRTVEDREGGETRCGCGNEAGADDAGTWLLEQRKFSPSRRVGPEALLRTGILSALLTSQLFAMSL